METQKKELIKASSLYATLLKRYNEEDALAEIDMAVDNYLYDNGRNLDPAALENAVIELVGECDEEMSFAQLVMTYPHEFDEVDIYIDRIKKTVDKEEAEEIERCSFSIGYKENTYTLTSQMLNEEEHFESMEKLWAFLEDMTKLMSNTYYDSYIKVNGHYYQFNGEHHNEIMTNMTRNMTAEALKVNGQLELS